MKLTIVLKKQDAEGFGGEVLEAMGMVRSSSCPTVFFSQFPIHDVNQLGTGDNSWSQPEQHSLRYVEALTDYGIRPLRVFQKTDSTAGLTPLHASVWADKVETVEKKAPVKAARVEKALEAIERALKSM